MKTPKLVLFDYGNTLVYEPLFDQPSGFRAVLAHCTDNPRGITPEDLAEAYSPALGKLMNASRAAGADLMDQCVKRRIYEDFSLRFDLEPTALELVFWDAASAQGRPMPGVAGFLRELRRRNIPTGIVSNTNFREESMKARVARYLPEHGFAFVLCSCEYGTRKPAAAFFRLALTKAGVRPEEAWYCGDNPLCDVIGAHDAGLFPVHYVCPELPCPYRSPSDLVEPDFPHLRIGSWEELTAVLDACE